VDHTAKPARLDNCSSDDPDRQAAHRGVSRACGCTRLALRLHLARRRRGLSCQAGQRCKPRSQDASADRLTARVRSAERASRTNAQQSSLLASRNAVCGQARQWLAGRSLQLPDCACPPEQTAITAFCGRSKAGQSASRLTTKAQSGSEHIKVSLEGP
jgi:hypothetical protein